MSDKPEAAELNHEDFEEFVAAVLKVDPQGISGKHRRSEEVNGNAGPLKPNPGDPDHA